MLFQPLYKLHHLYKLYFSMSKKHFKHHISFDVFNRVLNVSPHEWPKVVFCFLLKLFADTGKVIGHTVILTLVASRLGVALLPYAFIVTGFLIIIGTSFVSPMVEKVSKQKLVMGLTLSASILFLLAYGIISGDVISASHAASVAGAPEFVEHVPVLTYIFFAVLFIAEGLFFVQMEIVLALLIEGYFTPMESQRTFPIIESAAVFAGVIGGGLIAFLHLSSETLLLIWALTIALIIPTILVYSKMTAKLPTLQHRVTQKEHRGFIGEIRHGLNAIRKTPFLQSMAIIVFLYFMGFYILEYQYTRAFAQHTQGEEELSSLLGTYIFTFSLLGLAIQLLMSSRIVKRIGVVNSLFIHPLTCLIGYIAMMVTFSIPTAFASKIIFDSSSIVYKNAYLSSYYAVNHKVRETSKALIEGLVFPAGMIMGTLTLIIGKKLLPYDIQTLFFNAVLILIAVLLSFVLYRQRKNYSQLPIKAIRSQRRHEKQEAIEILGERGHVNAIETLITQMRIWKKKPKMKREKMKILQTFGRLKDDRTIPLIIDMFHDVDLQVQIAAVEALAEFEDVGKNFKTQTFARYRIVEAVKTMFLEVDSGRLRRAIAKLFAHLKVIEIVPFLVELLQSNDEELVADTISVMGKFDDPNIHFYIKHFLTHPNHKIRANTLIALWKFKEYRLQLIMVLAAMIDKKADVELLRWGVYVLGELKSKQEEQLLIDLLEHEDVQVRQNASISLAKIENNEAFDHIIRFVFHDNQEVAKDIYNMISQVPARYQKKVRDLINQEVSYRICHVLMAVHNNIEALDEADILELMDLYSLVDKHNEVAKLEEIMKHRFKIELVDVEHQMRFT